MTSAPFSLGRLDHVHIRVPNREEAARWYAEHFGFRPVQRFEFWARGFPGGPLQISADGGQTTLALFEATEGHPMVPQTLGVAFSLDADRFVAFARTLPCGIRSPAGELLRIDDIVDFDLCWAYNLSDPWGNQYELNCYDYARVAADLIAADGVTPTRYWPAELHTSYAARTAPSGAPQDRPLLILGRLPFDLASLGGQVDLHGFEVHAGTTLDDAKAAMANHSIEAVIMGAGLPLDLRLAVVKHVFEVSESTMVYMKDFSSGRDGFVPFLAGLLHSMR